MSPSLSSSLLLAFLSFASTCVGQTTLVVAAASDLTSLQPDLARAFQKSEPGAVLRFANGASAMLAQQIENGAPYDVFLSANAQFVDKLTALHKLDPDSVRIYAIGRIGLLWRDHKRPLIKDLAEDWVRIVALPNPKLAPYGVAAREALEHAGIWKMVEPKVVYGENVRQTLELFESGNADAVLTSASLLQAKDPDLIPADWHRPIVQKAGIVTASSNREIARKFLDFLLSPAGQAIFARFGFSPAPL